MMLKVLLNVNSGWNNDTIFTSRDRQRELVRKDQILKKQLKRANTELLKSLEVKRGRYMGPMDRTIEEIKIINKLKEKGEELKEKIISEFNHKEYSKEHNAAIAFKYLKEKIIFEKHLENVWSEIDYRKLKMKVLEFL